MTRFGWIILLTLLFFALGVVLVAWPDLRQLWHGRNWTVTTTEGPSADLAGVTVTVDQARAMILPNAQDRAVLYLRIGLSGDADRLEGWGLCDLGLIDGAGRKWRPLLNIAGLQILDILGDEGDTDNNCDQARILPPGDGGASMAVQPFLVPTDVLNDLRLEISGMATRPDALSLPIRPVLRPPG